MGVPTTSYERTNKWYEFAIQSWRFIVPRPDSYYDDRILVGYDSYRQTWRIFINDHDAGHAHDVDEAKALAALLYKLNPEWRFQHTIYRSTPNKPPNF